MKIFLSFLQSSKNHSIPAYSFWEYYIKNGIQEAGYQWAECPEADWALGLVPMNKNEHQKWKQDIWEKTVGWLKENPADLFLSYLYPGQVDESAIKEIQKMGIPCVNFFCDNVREFKKAPAGFNVFNLNWVPEYNALNLYKKAGYSYINLPMPMWVDPKYRIVKDETNRQVIFIGSKDIQRLLLFENVVKLNPAIPLVIYGNGWENEDQPFSSNQDYSLSKKIAFNFNFIKDEGFLSFSRKIQQHNINSGLSNVLNTKTNLPPLFEEYNSLTAESMITLGVNRYPSFKFSLLQPNTYSRLRDIEAPMLGACYLTEWTEGIEQLYFIGDEIETYNSPDELVEKVKELQTDAKKRKELKSNGQQRALNDHSIGKSLNQILQKLK